MFAAGGAEPVCGMTGGAASWKPEVEREVMLETGGAEPVYGRTGGAMTWEVAVGREARRWLVVKLAYVEARSCLIVILGRGTIERD